jgi:hypothetical protein
MNGLADFLGSGGRPGDELSARGANAFRFASPPAFALGLVSRAAANDPRIASEPPGATRGPRIHGAN